MTGRGRATFAGVLAECLHRPGILARELAWRWLYGVPALAAIAFACYHIYRVTSGTLAAAGADHITLDRPWRSAATVSVVAQVLRPVIVEILIWLLPLLGLGWAIAAGWGRNLVLRYYDPSLRWRPMALTGIQALRVIALAMTVSLWWGSVRWSAEASTVAGVPNVAVYFGLVAAFSIGFLVIWSLFSWVFFVAPMFVLIEGKSLAAGLIRSLRPSSAWGGLIGVNFVVSTIRFVVALFFTVLSLVPLVVISSAQSVFLYVWLVATTVLYMVVSGFFQVVRLAAFVEFWTPAPTPQNQVTSPRPDHVN